MLDDLDRVTGSTPFVINHRLPGMTHARLVRSTAAHARIATVRTADAVAVAGVVAVVTGADLRARADLKPTYGPVLVDQPVLAWEIVRYVGEPVAVVLAEEPAIAEHAAALVEVDYDELPAVFDAEQAIAPGAPVLFDDEPPRDSSFADVTLRTDYPRNICNTFSVVRGDTEAAFAAADHVVEDVFDSPAAHAVPLETHVVVADSRPDRTTVWTASQTPHLTRRQLALMLGQPLNRVRVVVPAVGGGFGAKTYATIEPVAVAASRIVGRPVRLHLTREEEFLTVTKHAMRVRLRTAVTADGRILGREATAYYNAGAYAGISPRKVMFGAYGINGPYAIANVRYDVHAVLTNTPPAGAYRGFAINQACWAYESQMDGIAQLLGLDPLELRRRNVLRDGDTFCTGETLDHLHYDQLLDEAARRIGWDGPAVERIPGGSLVRAKGMAVVIEGTITPSTSTASVRLNADGSVDVLTSSVEMGQGVRRALALTAARRLGIEPELVHVTYVDTDTTPYDQQTTASRSAYSMGGATNRAVDDAVEQLRQLAAELLEAAPTDIELADGRLGVAGTDRSLSFGEVVRRGSVGQVTGSGVLTTSGTLDPYTGQGVGSVHWHQAVGTAEVEVDLDTGRVTVLRYAGGAYAGRILDEVGAAHQCEGCLVFGLGNALMEELVFDRGQLVNGSMADYLVPTFGDVPRDTDFHLITGDDDAEPHGLGEPLMPPVCPAIANAVHRATGVRVRSLPLTAEKVLRGLDSRGATPPPPKEVKSR